MGDPAALGPRPRVLRLVRRAHELHHRGRVRHRRGAVRARVARRRPPDRQGHPPVPRRLLARHADGRRRRAAAPGLGPRVPQRRRPEDVEDERDRDPPVRAHRPLRRGLLPLLLHARDRSSGRTATSAGSRWSSATTPTSRTGSGTSRAGSSRCSAPTSTARCPSPGRRGRRGGPPGGGRRRRHAGTTSAMLERSRSSQAIARPLGRSSTARTSTSSRRSRGRSRRTSARRDELAGRPLRVGRNAPDPRRPDPPGHAGRRREALGASSGSTRRSTSQRLPEAGRVGRSSRPGPRRAKGEALFPRLDS